MHLCILVLKDTQFLLFRDLLIKR